MFCVLLFDGKINKKNAQKTNKCEINVFVGYGILFKFLNNELNE